MKTPYRLLLVSCIALAACGEGEMPVPDNSEDGRARVLKALGLGDPPGSGDGLGAPAGPGNGLGAVAVSGGNLGGGQCEPAVNQLINCGFLDAEDRGAILAECAANTNRADVAQLTRCGAFDCDEIIDCLSQ